MADSRDVSAYVLLGDPGAGKTTAFRCECAALGAEHALRVDARDFLTFDPAAHPEWRRKTAALLLADCDGCALRPPAPNARYPVLDRCVEAPEGAAESAAVAARTGPGSAVFRRALATRLFTSPDEGRFSPVHRHVAEFLAARHTARLIKDGLPVRRVLALITGGDGKVVTPLRGFAGWLAALCGRSADRRELIDRDPVGVAVYGDARGFPPDDKRRLLEVLYREASHLAEFPSASGAGAFVTADLDPLLREILSEPRRDSEHQRFVFFVLRAAAGPLPDVSELLLQVVRDDGRDPDVRAAALQAFFRTAPDGQETGAALVVLLDEVHRGDVSDPADELRDMLLAHLFPGCLPASRVLDYLTDGPGRKSFWHSLPERATESLSTAEARRIVVCVIDVAAPPPRAVPEPAATTGGLPSQSSAPR